MKKKATKYALYDEFVFGFCYSNSNRFSLYN